MKLLVKTSLIIIIIITVLFGTAYLFILFKGKPLITQQLQNLTKEEVSIGSFNLRFPLNLKIKDLEIRNLMKVDNIFVSISLLGLISGNIVLNEIRLNKPEFTYEKFPTQAVSKESAIESKGDSKIQRSFLSRLIFKQINIEDGKIIFTDYTVGDGIKIIIKDINFNLANLYLFPASVATNFSLSGKIPWQQDKEEGSIEARGWLNLFKKDMQAKLKIEDIDGIYLYPYYSNWVDLEKARIESAKLKFSSDIKGVNNNVTAYCRLELTDIVRTPRPPEESPEKAEKITDAVLDIFKALNQGKIVLDFTIRTKMDTPEFGFKDVKMAFENKLTEGLKKDKLSVDDIINFPSRFLENTVKGATDISKAVVNGAVAVGGELKQIFKEAFKKEKEEDL